MQQAPTIRKAPAEAGMTLIELTMSIILVSLLIISVVKLASQQATGRRTIEESRMAFLACRNALEEMRLVPFEDYPTMNGQGFDVPGFNGEAGALTPLAGDLDDLPGQFIVTVDQSSAGETIYWITARVTWRGNRGQQTFELRRLMANRSSG